MNLAFDFKKNKHQRGRESLNRDFPPEAVSKELVDSKGYEKPINTLQEEEIKTRIDKALINLPDKHRKAFVLFHYNDMTAKEIAEIMSCSESTVRSYVYRSVKNLRKQLKEYYIIYKE